MQNYPKDLTGIKAGVDKLQYLLDLNGYLTRADCEQYLMNNEEPYLYHKYCFWAGDKEKYYRAMLKLQDNIFEILRDSINDHKQYDKYKDEMMYVTEGIYSYLYQKYCDEHPESLTLLAAQEVKQANEGL